MKNNKTFLMKNLMFVLISALFFTKVNASDLDCFSLFQALTEREAFEQVHTKNLERVKKDLDFIYPALATGKQSPQVLLQFVLQKSSQKMTRMSKFNQAADVLDDAFQNSNSAQLGQKIEQAFMLIKDLTDSLTRSKKFYEITWGEEGRLQKKRDLLTEHILEVERYRKETENENESINKKYSILSEYKEEIAKEIDFINSLIGEIHSDISFNPQVQSFGSILQADILPHLVQLSVDFSQLQTLIETARDSLNIRLKANMASIAQARKITEVSLPVFVQQFPKMKTDSVVPSDKKRKEIFDFKPGQLVVVKGTFKPVSKDGYNNRIYAPGYARVIRILDDGSIHLQLYERDGTNIFEKTHETKEIAATSHELSSKGFQVGDRISMKKLGEGEIAGIYRNGDLAVMRDGDGSQIERYPPRKLTLVKKRD